MSGMQWMNRLSEEADGKAHVIGLLGVCGRLPCPFIALEYEPDSQTLAKWLDAQGSAAVDLLRRMEWALQLARALRTIHKCAVVHRDIKPENIIVSNCAAPRMA